jgi:hypothetical protein
MASKMPADLEDTQTEQVSIRIPKRMKEWYQKEAYEQSSPTERVTTSDLQRKALAEYANRNDAEDE